MQTVIGYIEIIVNAIPKLCLKQSMMHRTSDFIITPASLLLSSIAIDIDNVSSNCVRNN